MVFVNWLRTDEVCRTRIPPLSDCWTRKKSTHTSIKSHTHTPHEQREYRTIRWRYCICVWLCICSLFLSLSTHSWIINKRSCEIHPYVSKYYECRVAFSPRTPRSNALVRSVCSIRSLVLSHSIDKVTYTQVSEQRKRDDESDWERKIEKKREKQLRQQQQICRHSIVCVLALEWTSCVINRILSEFFFLISQMVVIVQVDTTNNTLTFTNYYQQNPAIFKVQTNRQARKKEKKINQKNRYNQFFVRFASQPVRLNIFHPIFWLSCAVNFQIIFS